MLQEPTILIVEDEPLLLASIQKKIKKVGFSSVAFATAEEVLEYLEQGDELPALIWLDYYLGSAMNGADLMKKIHDHARWSRIPVIVVSNTATQEKVEELLRLGAKKYFLKAEHLLQEIIDFISSLLKTS